MELEPIPGQPGLFRYTLGEAEVTAPIDASSLARRRVGPPPFGAPCCGQPMPDREVIPSVADRLGDLTGGAELADYLAQAADESSSMLYAPMQGRANPIIRNQRPLAPTIQGSLRGLRGSYSALRALGAADHEVERVPGTPDTWRICANFTVKHPAGMAGCGCGSRSMSPGLSGLRSFDLLAFTTSTIESAAVAVRALLPTLPIRPPADVVQALVATARAEAKLEEIRQKLRRAVEVDAAAPDGQKNRRLADDLRAFDTLRANLYQATLALWNPIIERVRSAPGGASILARLPQPELMPSVSQPDRPIPWVPSEAEVAAMLSGSWSSMPTLARILNESTTYLGITSPSSGTRGLAGGPIVIAGVALSPLVAALIVIVIGGVLVAGIYFGAKAIRDMMVISAQAEAFGDMTERRAAYMRDCSSRGSSAADCAQQASIAFPTPAEAGVALPPDAPLVNFDMGSLLLGAVVLGGAYYFATQTATGRGLVSRARAYVP